MSARDATAIAAEYSRLTGELMVSTSDVVTWLRACAKAQPHPCHRLVYDALADELTSFAIDATRHQLDGSGS
jgi:hypothetical protein